MHVELFGGVCRALLSVYRALLGVYRALLSVRGVDEDLLSACSALLSLCREVTGKSQGSHCTRVRDPTACPAAT